MALDIHIVNVGKGNCTIADHPSGRLTMIDIDDSRAVTELEKAVRLLLKGVGVTNPVDYFATNFPNRSIFRFILSHPDMDHLSGIKALFTKAVISNFWDTEHDKQCDSWEGSPYDEEDWKFYQKLRKKEINGVTVLKNIRGASNHFWQEDGISILHPHPDLHALASERDEYDHVSHVVKLSHAGRSVLVCGDATKEAFEHMFNDPDVDMTADIIIAPGHGSKNHIHEDAIKSVGHKVTLVSVAENVDYDRDYYTKFGTVLTTKHVGNIRINIQDDGQVSLRTQSGDYSDQ